MKRFLFYLLTISVCICLTVIAASSNKRPAARYVPGEILVKYKPGTGSSTVAALNARFGTSTLQHFSSLGVYRKKLPGTMSVGQALNIFRSEPAVKYAEPNYIYDLLATPNDTSFNQLWGLNNTGQSVNSTTGTSGCDISATQAWDTITNGSAKVVAVIDSGIDYNHTDISTNIAAGYDFVADNASPIDSYGHGTHVAGTIGAIGNNATGVAGINWTAQIMPLRVGDSDGLYTSSIIAAINYATTSGTVKIINASWGGYTPSDLIRDAISDAGAAGILFVAAAGNETNDNDTDPVYPASYGLSNIISVAATDQNDQLCSFSNYGKTSVHVGAPGRNIYSLAPSRADIPATVSDFTVNNGWTFGGTNNTWAISGGVLTNKPYVNNSDCYAVSPSLDLTGATYCRVEFTVSGNTEYYYDYNYYDYLVVEVSIDGGTTWTLVSMPITGSQSSYAATYDIRDYDGSAAVYVRLRFVSDSSEIVGTGYDIDNFKITKYSNVYTTAYQFKDGTSMATPHVAGMAALLWSQYPAYTMEQIRYMIINSVDQVSSLTNKTVSGGRINIYNALNLPAKPTGLTATLSAPAKADLSWTGNSPGATGFKIECKAGSGGTWSQIATVPVSSTTYSHVGTPSGTTVYYRVRSYDSHGNSFYSDEASVTTGSSTTEEGSSGGCFIATAAFGSPLEKNVAVLRAFRDRYLMASAPGRKFVELYYKTSPPLADFISRHESAKTLTRLMLAPAVFLSSAAVNGGPEILLSLLLVPAAAVCIFRRFLILNKTTAIKN